MSSSGRVWKFVLTSCAGRGGDWKISSKYGDFFIYLWQKLERFVR